MTIKIQEAIELIAHLRKIDEAYSNKLIKEIQKQIKRQSVYESLEIKVSPKVREDYQIIYETSSDDETQTPTMPPI